MRQRLLIHAAAAIPYGEPHVPAQLGPAQADIIQAIDGTDLGSRCVLGIGECDKLKPCSLHDQWSSSRDAIMKLLQEKSIAELAKDMEKPEYVTH